MIGVIPVYIYLTTVLLYSALLYGFQRNGEYEALVYTHRLISGWSWDRTDYTIILQNGGVVQYGTGQVRQNGPIVLFLSH